MNYPQWYIVVRYIVLILTLAFLLRLLLNWGFLNVSFLSPVKSQGAGFLPGKDVSPSWSVLDAKERRLQAFLDELAQCESQGDTFANGDHGLAFGAFQFHDGTLIAQTRKYGLLPEAEDKEVLNMRYATDYQRQLASLMIQDGGYGNWKNCVMKIRTNEQMYD